MIEKKDYETAINQFTTLLDNNNLNNEFHTLLIEHCTKKISEFPTEEKKVDDPMPEELKGMITGTELNA